MDIHINFDRAASDRLIEYATERGLTAFTLVADKNTFAALGRRVEVALRAADLAVEVIVLPGAEVVPDEGRIVHILMRAPVQTCYLAVGSGVITDLTRFVSYHTRNRFISLPTAPSMDGYATSSNALTIGGLKQSISGQAPEAIFCDIDTLAAAPRPLIAAGLGDTLAKFTSVNDLRLGHLLWGERWDEAIGQRMEDLAYAALARRIRSPVRTRMPWRCSPARCLTPGWRWPRSAARRRAAGRSTTSHTVGRCGCFRRDSLRCCMA